MTSCPDSTFSAWGMSAPCPGLRRLISTYYCPHSWPGFITSAISALQYRCRIKVGNKHPASIQCPALLEHRSSLLSQFRSRSGRLQLARQL